MSQFYPVCEPYLTGKEKEYVLDCLETGWISSAGTYLQKFEQEFAERCDRKYGIACVNGTAALHLGSYALDVKPGDEVIVPSFTIISTALAVMYQGGIPVFVDVDPNTWTMKAADVERAITSKTVGMIPVHIYGQTADMDALLELASQHQLWVMEDAAQLHGGRYKGKICGSFGDLSTFSFFANKIITTGEGGMVVTDSEELAERCREFRNLCFDKDPEKRFIHQSVGYNYRMTNVTAAMGCAQLESFDELVEKRRQVGLWYDTYLAEVEELQLPAQRDENHNVYWMYGVAVAAASCKKSKDEIRRSLREKGIQTRNFFYPLHRQPAFHDVQARQRIPSFPVSDALWETGFYLPSSSGLQESDIKTIVSELKQILR